MKNIDWNSVNEATNSRLTPGGYVCGILNAEDVPDKEYLRIEFDIADGPYKNYFREMRDRLNLTQWPAGGVLIRSYKPKAQPFFKAFLTSVQASNPGYTFQNDETTLRRRLVGLVLGEEEYEYNGEVKTRLRVNAVRSVKAIREGDFKVPDKKCLAPAASAPGYSSGSNGDYALIEDDGDLPF